MPLKPLDLHHDATTLDTPDAESVSRFQSSLNPSDTVQMGFMRDLCAFVPHDMLLVCMSHVYLQWIHM